MASRALADTSALLGVAMGKDQFHEQAVSIGRRFVGGGGRLVGTTMILGELHNLVMVRAGPATARDAVSALLDDPAYEWHDAPVSLIENAVSGWLYRFTDQRFFLTDAVSFELMRRERLTHAFAFDRHFVTAGFSLLK